MTPHARAQEARSWKEAKRDGAPVFTLRTPILVDGVHRAAVDMALIRGRYLIQGSADRIVEELRGFQALDCAHVALEVSYSTYPAILETIDLLVERVKPHLQT